MGTLHTMHEQGFRRATTRQMLHFVNRPRLNVTTKVPVVDGSADAVDGSARTSTQYTPNPLVFAFWLGCMPQQPFPSARFSKGLPNGKALVERVWRGNTLVR